VAPIPIGSLEQASVGTLEYALGFGLGLALGGVLAPEATRLEQDVWKLDPTKAVGADRAAAIVAENVEAESWGESEAKQHGIDTERFQALVREALEAPAVSELLRMLRRGTIGDGEFAHGLRKGKVETRWDSALLDLQHERLDPAAVAVAIQRGILHDPGYLPTAIDFAGSDVPEPARVGLDAVAEAKAQGESSERLAVRTRIVGLPPAPGELLQLVNRGVINEAAYRMGIAEGNTRNEWAPFLLKLRRRLLTPHEYAELHLRGWIDAAAMDAGASLSGMDTADTTRLFELLGRPIPVHQVTTGEARGGQFNGATGAIPAPFLRAMEQSSMRPEWYSLAYANRYTYPSAFVLRSLVQSHELTEAEGHKVLLDIGWEPTLAQKVATRWAGGTGAKADPHVTKAEAQLWGTLHKSYLDEESDATEARTMLGVLGVAAGADARILTLWDHEREIRRRTLTPAQIKKAWKETKFSRAVAMQRLEALGYDAADAATLLDE
jgi:hypothetical protein